MRSAFLSTLVAVAAHAVVPAGFADDYELVIITPHNEYIQDEFARGFEKQVGHPVKIRWIKQGTGQLLMMLDAQEKRLKGGSFDYDVFFGGGVPDHQLAADKGYLEHPDIPADVLAGIPKEIAGVANYDPKGLWYGAALSSFGVLMNKRGLANQGLPEIKTWEDLTNPRMFSWVIIADPRASASVRVSYELILQSYGWQKGWPMLMELAANSRTIADASSAIPNEVATGNVLAGPCIDFYARARVAQAGADVLAYVDPVGGSAITPDPISMLRKPPHRELAEKFITFVLSPAGQKLWALPVGEPGGPEAHALFRIPIRPDVCEQNAGKLLVSDPYKAAASGVFRRMNDTLQNARTTLVAELMGAALVDLHGDLTEAWKALIDGGMKPAALAEWNKLPFSEEEGLAIAKKLDAGDREARKMTREWTRLFKEKYERVKKLAK